MINKTATSALILSLVMLLSACSPGGRQDSVRSATEMYKNARDLGDINTCIVAAHELYAADTSSIALKDTLTRLYFAAQMFEPAIKLGEQVLRKEPRNLSILEHVASAHQGLGQGRAALPYYNTLLEINRKPEYLYQIGLENFKSDELEAAAIFAKKMLELPNSETTKMTVLYTNRPPRQVIVAAVATNLLGAVKVKQKKYDEARTYFVDAIKMDGDYDQAAENYRLIKDLK